MNLKHSIISSNLSVVILLCRQLLFWNIYDKKNKNKCLLSCYLINIFRIKHYHLINLQQWAVGCLELGILLGCLFVLIWVYSFKYVRGSDTLYCCSFEAQMVSCWLMGAPSKWFLCHLTWLYERAFSHTSCSKLINFVCIWNVTPQSHVLGL